MTYLSKPKLWTRDFLAISFASFFFFIPFYTLMIALPIYTMENLGGSEAQVGFIVTAFIISAVIIRPFSGRLLDRFGKKQMLLFALIIFLIASVLYLGTSNFTLLLIIRFFHGFGFGIATLAAGTIVANIVPDHRRGEGMGYYALFMNLAMVIGPFLGLMIIQYSNFKTLFIVMSLSSLASLMAAVIPKIPENFLQSEHSSPQRERLKLSDLLEKSVMPIAIIVGLLAFSYASVLSFISVYAKEINLVETASFFFVAYAVFLILTRPISGRLFDKYGENYVLYPTIILFGIGVFILSQTTSSFSFLLAGALIGIGYGTLGPAIQAVCVQSVAPHRRGVATATYFTFFDGGLGLGSVVLGFVAASIGLSNLYLYTSLFIIGCAGLYYLLHGRFQGKKDTVYHPSKLKEQTVYQEQTSKAG